MEEQPRARVVTLCGSRRFAAEVADAEVRLTLAGCVVLRPAFLDLAATGAAGDTGDTGDGDLVDLLGRLHLQRVRMADEVHVVDPGGHVGDSTRREVELAESLGIPVTYLSRATPGPPQDVPPGPG